MSKLGGGLPEVYCMASAATNVHVSLWSPVNLRTGVWIHFFYLAEGTGKCLGKIHKHPQVPGRLTHAGKATWKHKTETNCRFKNHSRFHFQIGLLTNWIEETLRNLICLRRDMSWPWWVLMDLPTWFVLQPYWDKLTFMKAKSFSKETKIGRKLQTRYSTMRKSRKHCGIMETEIN